MSSPTTEDQAFADWAAGSNKSCSRGGLLSQSDIAQIFSEQITGRSLSSLASDLGLTGDDIQHQLFHFCFDLCEPESSSSSTHHGARWSPEEVQVLTDLHGAGVSPREIAAELGRSERAVVVRLLGERTICLSSERLRLIGLEPEDYWHRSPGK